MADELDLDLELEEDKENKVEKRIKDLSGKVRSTAEERDAAKAQAEKAEADRQAALKDAEFYKNFNTTASKYQGAAEHQDKIREKVMAGYDIEDATVSVLNKEGKFSPQPQVQRESPTGGSATTTLTSGEKSVKEMTQAERLAGLAEAERRGDLGLT